uniref:Uncharacterized protein n=1 Tax=Setaria italica TaxID=4555 RepID=K3YFE0_SETIT
MVYADISFHKKRNVKGCKDLRISCAKPFSVEKCHLAFRHYDKIQRSRHIKRKQLRQYPKKLSGTLFCSLICNHSISIQHSTNTHISRG